MGRGKIAIQNRILRVLVSCAFPCASRDARRDLGSSQICGLVLIGILVRVFIEVGEFVVIHVVRRIRGEINACFDGGDDGAIRNALVAERVGEKDEVAPKVETENRFTCRCAMCGASCDSLISFVHTLTRAIDSQIPTGPTRVVSHFVTRTFNSFARVVEPCLTSAWIRREILERSDIPTLHVCEQWNSSQMSSMAANPFSASRGRLLSRSW